MPEVLKNAYRRVKMLAKQEQAEFDKWVRYILLSVCGDKEAVPEDLRKQILEQKDLVILRKWLKLASGVNNIQEFIQRM